MSPRCFRCGGGAGNNDWVPEAVLQFHCENRWEIRNRPSLVIGWYVSQYASSQALDWRWTDTSISLFSLSGSREYISVPQSLNEVVVYPISSAQVYELLPCMMETSARLRSPTLYKYRTWYWGSSTSNLLNTSNEIDQLSRQHLKWIVHVLFAL